MRIRRTIWVTSVENSLWKRLWTCHNIDYRMNDDHNKYFIHCHTAVTYPGSTLIVSFASASHYIKLPVEKNCSSTLHSQGKMCQFTPLI